METFPFSYAYAYAYVALSRMWTGRHKHKHKRNETAVSDDSGNSPEKEPSLGETGSSKIASSSSSSYSNTEFYEKLAEAVRNFPCLYDKSSGDFKDANKKKLAWKDVAEATGIESGKLTWFIKPRIRIQFLKAAKLVWNE